MPQPLVMLMGIGLGPMLVVLVGPVLTLAIKKEKSIKIRNLAVQGGLGGGVLNTSTSEKRSATCLRVLLVWCHTQIVGTP